MKRRALTRLLVLLTLLCVSTMIVPLCIALVLGETKMIQGFGLTMTLTAAAAMPALVLTRKTAIRFTISDGFLLVFLAWIAACFSGALPYLVSGHIPRFTDAVFESVSGFTTTGASVIADLDIMPRSLVFWRAETQWLGGMGMIVLTVALFPFLGIGGFQMIKAEFTGPDKERVTPKITETAKILWLMYLALTALETALLALAGMSLFDAVIHAFSTMATGGFSSRNEGLAFWDSPLIIWITAIFMLAAGCNFALLFRLFRRKWNDIARNSEVKAYAGIILAAAAVCSLALLASRSGAGESIRRGFFYTVSVLTTTGFTEGGQTFLPPLAKAALFILMFIGGCSGSTAGGIKVIRHVILFKQTGNELKKILYPRGVFSVRLNGKIGRKDLVYGVAGFIFLYFALLAAAALVVASSGADHGKAFGTALLTLGNIGLDPRIAQTAGFLHYPAYVKWTLSFIMIAGRLELWTAFVFFTRDYWR